MLKILRYALPLTFALSIQTAHARVQISEAFSPEQKNKIKESLKQIESFAPAKFNTFINDQEILLDLSKEIPKTGDKEAASAQGSSILLNPQILDSDYFETKIKTRYTRHKDLKTFLSATLVHEISHLLDKKALTPEDNNYIKMNCTPVGDDRLDNWTAQVCNTLRQKNGLYSYYPSFVSAAGYQYNVGFSRRNFREQSSPDAYEFTNLRESFAVNMEYFVMDPSYGCKKPAVNNVLKRYFGTPPLQKENCAEVMGITYTSAGGSVKTLRLSQVQSISYFFASKGEGMASKYGHAMLYLTVCPEAKDPAKTNCDNDIEDHVVISPAALIYKGLSSIDGMTGKYDLTYFVVPATTAIRDYTMVELRDLERYPLKVNTQELGSTIFDFVWNFTEKYYFLSNNCAHGVTNIINSVFNMNIVPAGGFSPLDLRQTLMDKGLIDKKPKAVFAADFARKKIKDRVLQAVAVPWDKLTQTTQTQRETLYNAAIQDKKVSWADLAQVEYMIVQAKEEAISINLNKFVVEKRQMKDNEIKDAAKKLAAIGELVENDSYGVPEYNFVKSHINDLVKTKLNADNKAFVEEYQKANADKISEYEAADRYYRTLLAASIE